MVNWVISKRSFSSLHPLFWSQETFIQNPFISWAVQAALYSQKKKVTLQLSDNRINTMYIQFHKSSLVWFTTRVIHSNSNAISSTFFFVFDYSWFPMLSNVAKQKEIIIYYCQCLAVTGLQSFIINAYCQVCQTRNNSTKQNTCENVLWGYRTACWNPAYHLYNNKQLLNLLYWYSHRSKHTLSAI